jgi:hypothetical protein
MSGSHGHGGAPALRRQAVTWMSACALLAAGLGAATFLPPAPPKTRLEVGSAVAPGLIAKASDIAIVMVTTGEESYHLVRNPNGWVIPEKGNYPVRADRLEALAQALAAMRYARPMTRDERKFDRIGLGDPLNHGTGALLEVGDGHGETFLKLIVGHRDGRTYVREPDDLQAWAVETEAGGGEAMPPLQRGARWLDLDVADVPIDTVREVEVRPAQGPAYRLVPLDAAGTRFGLAPPYSQRRVVTAFAPTLVAGGLSHFAPSDVRQAGAADGAIRMGAHVTRSKQGLEVTAIAWRLGEQGWLMLAATAAAGAPADVQREAAAINTRAAGWMFAMSETDWRAYATPLSEIVAPSTSVGPRQ